MSECKKRFPKNPRFIFPNGVISAEVGFHCALVPPLALIRMCSACRGPTPFGVATFSAAFLILIDPMPVVAGPGNEHDAAGPVTPRLRSV